MHVTHFDPWRILSAAMGALVLALAAAVLLVAAARLDFGSGSSGGDASATTPPVTATPTWVQDPIASPVSELRTP